MQAIEDVHVEVGKYNNSKYGMAIWYIVCKQSMCISMGQ